MNNKSLIEFPCDFPIKIVGVNSNDFVEQITNIVKSHFPNFTNESLSQNAPKPLKAKIVTTLPLKALVIKAYLFLITKTINP